MFGLDYFRVWLANYLTRTLCSLMRSGYILLNTPVQFLHLYFLVSSGFI